ncbi:hypothetical protein [Kribbella sp. NPDC048915]|uniref:hypothetical protein n=1 Tax=Kribbella sp. NPDC048915 TaxID=3155148 RepID=UPI0033F16CA2
MTDVMSRPVPGVRRRGWIRVLVQAIRYDVLLAPVGVMTMVDALSRAPHIAPHRRRHLAAQGAQQPESRWRRFGVGVLSVVLGVGCWFLMGLGALAVVRGLGWGLVEDRVVEPGTWGGPSWGGAWAVHALLAVPCLVVLAAVLRGIAALHQRLVRGEGKWVLPATVAVAAGWVALFWSWLGQV